MDLVPEVALLPPEEVAAQVEPQTLVEPKVLVRRGPGVLEEERGLSRRRFVLKVPNDFELERVKRLNSLMLGECERREGAEECEENKRGRTGNGA